jgi:phage gp29-like protein
MPTAALLLIVALLGAGGAAVGIRQNRQLTAAQTLRSRLQRTGGGLQSHSNHGQLSLRRPAATPSAPPSGQDARDLLFDTYVEHPGHGATIEGVINIFREAEMGYPQRQCDLYDDLEQPDGHLASLFEKRNEAVSGKPWVIQAGGQGDDAELAAHVLRTVFDGLPMIEVFQHLLTFNKYGYSAVEIDWTIRIIDGREWIIPSWFTIVRARRFRIGTGWNGEPADELRLYADIMRPRGDELRPYKWITIRQNAAVPLACGGLMRGCAFPAVGKRYGFRDWLIYSDKYGKPLPVASYDETADDDSKEVATEIIASIGSDIGAVKPKSIDIDFKEPKNTDNSHTHGGLIAHCNAEMSKRVNGSTLANDNAGSGGASYALGAVHDSVRWEAVQYDAGRLETAFNTQVFAAFCVFNNIAAAPPKLRIQVVRELAPLTRVQVADFYKNKLGGDLSKSQMAQELGFREPTDDDDALPGMPAPATSDPMPTKAAA